jgi:hypothetical protein
MSLCSPVVVSYSLYNDLSIQCRYDTSCCNYRTASAHLCYIWENSYAVSCPTQGGPEMKPAMSMRLVKWRLTSCGCGQKTTGLWQLASWLAEASMRLLVESLEELKTNKQINRWTELAAGSQGCDLSLGALSYLYWELLKVLVYTTH